MKTKKINKSVYLLKMIYALYYFKILTQILTMKLEIIITFTTNKKEL
jgi:hypothetical protein